MSKTKTRWTRMHTAVVVVVAVGLTACGGGGGGGGDEPALIDLTAGNMESVAHASAVAPFALGVSSMAIADAGPSAMGQVVKGVLGAVRVDRMKALAASARPLTAYSEQRACSFGGTESFTWDDRDGSGDPSPGDVITIVDSKCQDTSYAVLDGSLAFEIQRVVADPFALDGRLTMTQLSQRMTDGRHAMTINGIAQMNYSMTSESTDLLKVTAEGEVVVAVSTHRYTDTVTLQPGYWHQLTSDWLNETVSTLFGGTIRSDAAGGLFQVSTDMAFSEQASDDYYPSSGASRATGNKGTMLLRALSGNEVKIDLDDNNCGVAEYTQTQTWDWLM